MLSMFAKRSFFIFHFSKKSKNNEPVSQYCSSGLLSIEKNGGAHAHITMNDNFGWTLGQLRANLGKTLGWLWADFLVDSDPTFAGFEPLWGRGRVDFGRSWVDFKPTLGDLRPYSG